MPGGFRLFTRPSNRPAIGFYERLGAVPMSEGQVYRLTGEALEALGAAAGRNGG